MTLAEQAARRAALARDLGRVPVRWVATAEVAAQLAGECDHLAGLPIDVGKPRSEWGLDLVCE